MIFRGLLQKTGLYPGWKKLGHYPDFLYWKLRGRPTRSPHLLKQRTLKEYAARFGIRILVETGTYYGEMVDAIKRDFDQIYTVEMDPELVAHARARFAAYPHIQVLQGKSEKMVPDLLKSITAPCLFWLDAGYFGWAGHRSPGFENRLKGEVRAILDHPVASHVILIDDARTFTGRDGVPSLEEFREFVLRDRPGWAVTAQHDMVRICRQR
jgi:hypothetical protein